MEEIELTTIHYDEGPGIIEPEDVQNIVKDVEDEKVDPKTNLESLIDEEKVDSANIDQHVESETPDPSPEAEVGREDIELPSPAESGEDDESNSRVASPQSKKLDSPGSAFQDEASPGETIPSATSSRRVESDKNTARSTRSHKTTLSARSKSALSPIDDSKKTESANGSRRGRSSVSVKSSSNLSVRNGSSKSDASQSSELPSETTARTNLNNEDDFNVSGRSTKSPHSKSTSRKPSVKSVHSSKSQGLTPRQISR